METHREMLERIGRSANATEMGGTFRLGPHGSFDHGSTESAPAVWHDDDDDIVIEGDGWEALTGMTGQYSYNGAVMHASEYIGAGVATRLLELAQDEGSLQTFAVVAVDVLPTDEDPEPEPAGWAILRRTA
jgi:hypothetical protein